MSTSGRHRDMTFHFCNGRPSPFRTRSRESREHDHVRTSKRHTGRLEDHRSIHRLSLYPNAHPHSQTNSHPWTSEEGSALWSGPVRFPPTRGTPFHCAEGGTRRENSSLSLPFLSLSVVPVGCVPRKILEGTLFLCLFCSSSNSLRLPRPHSNKSNPSLVWSRSKPRSISCGPGPNYELVGLSSTVHAWDLWADPYVQLRSEKRRGTPSSTWVITEDRRDCPRATKPDFLPTVFSFPLPQMIPRTSTYAHP